MEWERDSSIYTDVVIKGVNLLAYDFQIHI